MKVSSLLLIFELTLLCHYTDGQFIGRWVVSLNKPQPFIAIKFTQVQDIIVTADMLILITKPRQCYKD